MSSLIGSFFLRVTSLAAVAFSMVVAVGCLQTSMLPARQLESGDVALSGSIDEPGLLYIPRANGQFTYGVGGGDVTLNVGGTASALGGGVTGRAYLTDVVTAETQVQVANVLDGRQGLLLGGLQGVPSDENPLYAGGSFGLLRGNEVLESTSHSESAQTVPFVGATLGYGRIDLGEAWGMQIELEINVPIPPTAEDDRPLPPSRLSVGFFRYID